MRAHDPYGSFRPRFRRKPETVAFRRMINPVSGIGPDAVPRLEGWLCRAVAGGGATLQE
jgi:hypothetical protein